MPASAQMTESPKNTNTLNGRIRVEGRVTRPSKSTSTECGYVIVTRDDKERRCFDEERRRMTKDDKFQN